MSAFNRSILRGIEPLRADSFVASRRVARLHARNMKLRSQRGITMTAPKLGSRGALVLYMVACLFTWEDANSSNIIDIKSS